MPSLAELLKSAGSDNAAELCLPAFGDPDEPSAHAPANELLSIYSVRLRRLSDLGMIVAVSPELRERLGDLGAAGAQVWITNDDEWSYLAFTDAGRRELLGCLVIPKNHFSVPRVNVVESDSGFAVEVLGRTGIRYTEGEKTMLIDSEVLATAGIAVRASAINRWDPPHDRDEVPAGERRRIIENILDALAYTGGQLQID